jgi:hypothetical protein
MPEHNEPKRDNPPQVDDPVSFGRCLGHGSVETPTVGNEEHPAMVRAVSPARDLGVAGTLNARRKAHLRNQAVAGCDRVSGITRVRASAMPSMASVE